MKLFKILVPLIAFITIETRRRKGPNKDCTSSTPKVKSPPECNRLCSSFDCEYDTTEKIESGPFKNQYKCFCLNP
jgi:hypothetical protein